MKSGILKKINPIFYILAKTRFHINHQEDETKKFCFLFSWMNIFGGCVRARLSGLSLKRRTTFHNGIATTKVNTDEHLEDPFSL